MSTRSFIAIKDGPAYKAVYCHFDGYDKDHGVGPTLRQYYDSYNQAKKLIELGSLSYIYKEKVVAYHRDKGQSWEKCQPNICQNYDTLCQQAKRQDADYLYVYAESGWITIKLN